MIIDHGYNNVSSIRLGKDLRYAIIANYELLNLMTPDYKGDNTHNGDKTALKSCIKVSQDDISTTSKKLANEDYNSDSSSTSNPAVLSLGRNKRAKRK